MCGIVGVHVERGNALECDALNAARDQLVHRGPDAAGYLCDADTYFGFRRLSILDLSESGNQPMERSDVWIVFNGEVYNYLELRSLLEERGCRFTGTSDTEVALQWFIHEGVKCFERFNGMFAMALYDRRARKIVLARDRIGKKPLYVLKRPGLFAFASEMRAIQALPGGRTGVSAEALAYYFAFGFVPRWRAAFEDVIKVPPGTWMEFDIASGSLSAPRPYWSLRGFDPSVRSESEAVEAVSSLIDDATRIRLHSDVPLGTFLSGGIDSGIITGAVARQRREVPAITAIFPGEPEDEADAAASTAKRLGIPHLMIRVPTTTPDDIASCLSWFDEPFADFSAVPTSLVCKAARESGLTVLLSGDGGDEVFAGYENHSRAWAWRFVDRVASRTLRSLVHWFSDLLPADRQLQRFVSRLGEPVGISGLGAKLYLFERWPHKFLRADLRLGACQVEEIMAHSAATSADSPLTAAQLTDLSIYLPDDVLVKVDRMSMKNSIEVRSPLLDYRLIEMAFQIAERLRVRPESKNILRRVAERTLPSEVVRRPKKGFGVPVDAWFFSSSRWALYRDHLLSSPGLKELFRSDGLEKLWSSSRENVALRGSALKCLALSWWLEANASPTNVEPLPGQMALGSRS
jgi:asparagine synthase (glutamine-hydrolysing)